MNENEQLEIDREFLGIVVVNILRLKSPENSDLCLKIIDYINRVIDSNFGANDLVIGKLASGSPWVSNDLRQDDDLKNIPNFYHLVDGDYSRENLIGICESSVVQESKWHDRDSPSAHEQLGLCWILLKAGCEFDVQLPKNDRPNGGCVTNERTIWLRIVWKTFNSFEHGRGNEESKLFYLPTPERLRSNSNKDWY